MDKFNEVLNETMNRYDETFRKLAEGEPPKIELSKQDLEDEKIKSTK